jgi:hypothetical protein
MSVCVINNIFLFKKKYLKINIFLWFLFFNSKLILNIHYYFLKKNNIFFKIKIFKNGNLLYLCIVNNLKGKIKFKKKSLNLIN